MLPRGIPRAGGGAFPGAPAGGMPTPAGQGWGGPGAVPGSSPTGMSMGGMAPRGAPSFAPAPGTAPASGPRPAGSFPSGGVPTGAPGAPGGGFPTGAAPGYPAPALGPGVMGVARPYAIPGGAPVSAPAGMMMPRPAGGMPISMPARGVGGGGVANNGSAPGPAPGAYAVPPGFPVGGRPGGVVVGGGGGGMPRGIPMTTTPTAAGPTGYPMPGGGSGSSGPSFGGPRPMNGTPTTTAATPSGASGFPGGGAPTGGMGVGVGVMGPPRPLSTTGMAVGTGAPGMGMGMGMAPRGSPMSVPGGGGGFGMAMQPPVGMMSGPPRGFTGPHTASSLPSGPPTGMGMGMGMGGPPTAASAGVSGGVPPPGGMGMGAPPTGMTMAAASGPPGGMTSGMGMGMGMPGLGRSPMGAAPGPFGGPPSHPSQQQQHPGPSMGPGMGMHTGGAPPSMHPMGVAASPGMGMGMGMHAGDESSSGGMMMQSPPAGMQSGGGGMGMGGAPRGLSGPGGMGGGGGGGFMGGAPAASIPMAEVNEAHQARSAFMALTMGAIPATAAMVKRSALPFGLCVHPLAEGEGSLGRGGIPLVNFGTAGVIRCKKCRAYVNPFSKFVDGGRRWRCNLCSYTNDVPPAYFAPTDGDGNRVDVGDRPELYLGSVEFVAPTEYMVRPPQPPVYMFVLDVSFASVTSGALQTATAAILEALPSLPGEDRTQVGFVTFDSTVHFYNLKASLKAPQMIVVPDVSDLFIPVPEELLVNLSESRSLVETLLRNLPAMFASSRQTESVLGPALDAAFQVMQHIGGKMVVVNTTLPSLGPGKLKVRELAKLLGSEQEHQLLAPEAGDGGAFYKTKAIDFSRQQISVDMFLIANSYTDVATLGALARYTAGQVYYYPSYTPAVDANRLHGDLLRDLSRTTGFESVMRIRTTKGLNITNFYGNFFIRGTDLLALPNVTADTAFNVELNHEEALQPGGVIAIQAALLYTTSSGERRINVHTICKPVTTVLADLFRNVEVDAVCNLIAKVALDHALRTGLAAARQYLQKAVVDIMRGYRASSGAAGSGPLSRGPMPPQAATPQQGGDIKSILPDNLMLLPLYTLAMQKCTLYRGGDNVRSDERSSLVYRMLTMPVSGTRIYIYPRMYSLHDIEDAMGRPDTSDGTSDRIVLPSVVNLTVARLVPNGVFLVDNGIEMYMFFGRGVAPQLLSALFGISSFEGVDMSTLQLVPQGNDYSERVCAIVADLQRQAPQIQKLRFVREGAGDLNEFRFSWNLVEDRQNFKGGGVTYSEYLPIIQKESQLAQLGGTEETAS